MTAANAASGSLLTCDVCGFDAARWSADDLARTLAHTDDLVGYVLEGHASGAVPEYPPSEAGAAGDQVAAAHRLVHHLDELASHRRTVETFEPMTGTVAAMHASTGGVPKLPIAAAMVDQGGVVGDAQGNRRHHGRPWQALCVWSADQLERLRAEGHPVEPGGTGENLLIEGVDWSRMRGGLTIEVGTVVARTSSPAEPCHQIGDCFTDRHWNRIDHVERPGWARWYASVLRGGEVRTGDAVTIRA